MENVKKKSYFVGYTAKKSNVEKLSQYLEKKTKPQKTTKKGNYKRF